MRFAESLARARDCMYVTLGTAPMPLVPGGGAMRVRDAGSELLCFENPEGSS